MCASQKVRTLKKKSTVSSRFKLQVNKTNISRLDTPLIKNTINNGQNYHKGTLID